MIGTQGISTGKELREVLEQIENELLFNLKSQFKNGRDKPIDKIDMKQWQDKHLAQFNNFKESNKKIIKKYIPNINQSIFNDLEESYKFGLETTRKRIEHAKKQGVTIEKQNVTRDFKEHPKAKALVSDMQIKLNASFNNVLRGLEQQFTDTIMKVPTMAYVAPTLYNAIDTLAKPMLFGGIVGGMTAAGHKMNFVNQIELNAVEISQEAMFTGKGEQANANDLHLVFITVHASTCKSCTKYQNKILIDDVYQDGTPDDKHILLSEAIKDGLFHPNCRCNPITFIPGIDTIPTPFEDVPTKRNSKGKLIPDKKAQHELYDKEQQQRYMERKIRQWRRVEIGASSDEEINRAHLKVLEWRARRGHLVENTDGLYRANTWREKTTFKMPRDNRYADLKYNKKIFN